jgi:hypothetical protein
MTEHLTQSHLTPSQMPTDEVIANKCFIQSGEITSSTSAFVVQSACGCVVRSFNMNYRGGSFTMAYSARGEAPFESSRKFPRDGEREQ